MSMEQMMAGMGGGGGMPDLASMLPPELMGMDPRRMSRMNEEENNKNSLKVSKHIKEMDGELMDRFKALKAVQNALHDADDDEQKEIRKLEVIFEQKYKAIYNLRCQYTSGALPVNEELVAAFDDRASKLKDEAYDKLEVVPCDVKAVQNTPNGIHDFWLKSMLNHSVGRMIEEKDRPILGYLQNIELDLHDASKGEGFDLMFHFQENTYFEGTLLKKEFHCKHKGMVDKTVST